MASTTDLILCKNLCPEPFLSFSCAWPNLLSHVPALKGASILWPAQVTLYLKAAATWAAWFSSYWRLKDRWSCYRTAEEQLGPHLSALSWSFFLGLSFLCTSTHLSSCKVQVSRVGDITSTFLLYGLQSVITTLPKEQMFFPCTSLPKAEMWWFLCSSWEPKSISLRSFIKANPAKLAALGTRWRPRRCKKD